MARSRALKATPLPLNKGDVGLYLLVTIILGFGYAIISTILNTHCDGWSGPVHTCTTNIPFTQILIASVVVEASGIIVIGLKRRQGPAWFGFIKPSANLTGQLLLGGVGLVAVVDVATMWLGQSSPFFRKAQFDIPPHPSVIFLLTFGLFAVLFAPVLEEFLFRGIYFRAIWAKTGPLVAAVISSLIFTLAHGISGATVGLFAIGLYLCYMYKRSGSIVPGMILHAANNLFAVILLAFGVR